MLVYRNGLPPDAGISINYRIYDRFLIRRLQAKTNISTDVYTTFNTRTMQQFQAIQQLDLKKQSLHVQACWLRGQYQRSGNPGSVDYLNSRRRPIPAVQSMLTYLMKSKGLPIPTFNSDMTIVKLASADFGRLTPRLYQPKRYNIDQSISVDSRLSFCTAMRLGLCVVAVCRLRWWHVTTHVEIRRTASVHTFDSCTATTPMGRACHQQSSWATSWTAHA